MPNLDVGVIIMRDRASVLLVRHSGSTNPVWALPRGMVLDKESVRTASVRVSKGVTGLDVDPKQSLFFCEQLEPSHDIALFCLAVSAPDATLPATDWELRWADVRELGKIQTEEGMEDFSAQAFLKFSDYLRAQAMSASGSTTVN